MASLSSASGGIEERSAFHIRGKLLIRLGIQTREILLTGGFDSILPSHDITHPRPIHRAGVIIRMRRVCCHRRNLSTGICPQTHHPQGPPSRAISNYPQPSGVLTFPEIICGPMQLTPVTLPDERKAAKTGWPIGRAGFKCIARIIC